MESPANVGWSASVTPLATEITGEVHTSLLVLLAAVALLLLMAVASLVMLTLSLTARREREFAIRRAVGATDRRLFRQLLTQSALVGAVGTLVGRAIAIAAVRALVSLLPPSVPRAESVALDTRVLLVTTTMAVLATAVFGGIGAMRGAVRGPLPPARGVRTRRRSTTGRLVTIELAIALALSIMAVSTSASSPTSSSR